LPRHRAAARILEKLSRNARLGKGGAPINATRETLTTKKEKDHD
jgi:hypothetical protein